MIEIVSKGRGRIAFISSYPPRKCGIATFTSDLLQSIKKAAGQRLRASVIAMHSDFDNVNSYHRPVELTIRKNVPSDYVSAAEYINFNNFDLVCLQHEFGLYGGEAGSYLKFLLDRLSIPVVTTLHTVLEDPPAEYLTSLKTTCGASAKVIVMNQRGIGMLRDTYKVPVEKIELIPHGIPDLPFVETEDYKRRLGFSGRKTILTFGLLSKNKGIDFMLRAMPTILKAQPSVLYIVLGATHPDILFHDGPSYKSSLEKRVGQLGLGKHVLFHNQFVDDQQLRQFLCAADVYVTPYLKKEQLTSGTLALALGAGKAVVSTPYWAAQELLADGRGKLVRNGASGDMAKAILEILRSSSLSQTMRERAWRYARSMTWPKVGQSYWELFKSQFSSIALPVREAVRPLKWDLSAATSRAS